MAEFTELPAECLRKIFYLVEGANEFFFTISNSVRSARSRSELPPLSIITARNEVAAR